VQPREREKTISLERKKEKNHSHLLHTFVTWKLGRHIWATMLPKFSKKKLLLYFFFFQYHTWAQGAVCGGNTLFNFWGVYPSKQYFEEKGNFFEKIHVFRLYFFWTLVV